MKNGVLLFVLFGLHATAFAPLSVPIIQKNGLQQLSRQCIKIWCLIRNVVEDVATDAEAALQVEPVETLDAVLCRIMQLRDVITKCDLADTYDKKTADYIDSALDCIGQYTYDLVARYPGSWSTVIQEQVFRTQEAYAQRIMPLITN